MKNMMNKVDANSFVWEIKYRPNKVDDVILPDRTKKKIKQYMEEKAIPPLLFCGSSGLGKTTLARAICEELGIPYTVINASLDRNLDTLRDRIIDYASTKSFHETNKKAIILDEYDFTSINSMQAMRGVLDLYSKNCFFIATCNYPERITEHLRSRFQIFDFSNISKPEAREMKIQFYRRLQGILAAEGVECEKNILVDIINTNFPDVRKMIGILQGSVVDGKIDADVVKPSLSGTIDVAPFMQAIREGKFDVWRKWVSNALAVSNYNTVFKEIYKNLLNFGIKQTPENVSNAYILIANYIKYCNDCPDIEIGLTAFASDFFTNIEFEG